MEEIRKGTALVSRLPFDPSKMSVKSQAPSAARGGSLFGSNAAPPGTPATPESPARERPAAPLTVSQLAAVIDGALRIGVPAKVRVVGEISGFNDRTHWYFSLKDAESVVSCVMFASAARAVRFRPENGHEVVVTGRVEFFGKQGRTQFYVEKLEPVGAGALDLEFRRLCEELRALGWFDPERKRALPTFPRRIAVVTSRTSAAYQDVLNTVGKRCPAVGVALVDVRVQGDGAAGEVIRALRWLSSEHESLGIDAILLTRGGGSKEDLWSFNDRGVAEAIIACEIPVVAAIGHETDTTIAELVADERCATPTQAAMRLTPDAAALGEQLDSLGSRLTMSVRRELREAVRRVDAAARGPTLTDPLRLVGAQLRRVDDLARRAASGVRDRTRTLAMKLERLAGRLESHRPARVYARRAAELDRCAALLASTMRGALRSHDLDAPARRLTLAMGIEARRAGAEMESLERALDLVGPASVLRRGYSMTTREDGSVIRSVAEVSEGSRIKTVLADGSFGSVVAGGAAGAAALPASAFQTISKRRPKRKAQESPGLFGEP